MKKIQITYSNGETDEFDLENDPFEDIVRLSEDFQSVLERRFDAASFQEKREVLQNIADEFDGSLRSYSGRGMYGKICAGIVCEGYVANEVIAKVASYGITDSKTDSMGLQTIVYWPRLAWEDDEDEDDEE